MARSEVYRTLRWTRYQRRGAPVRWKADDPHLYIEFSGGFDPCYELWRSTDEEWVRVGFYPSLAGAQDAAEEAMQGRSEADDDDEARRLSAEAVGWEMDGEAPDDDA